MYCVPWSLRKILLWIKQNYNDPDIFITENGFSVEGEDSMKGESALQDKVRIQFLQEYLKEALKAINQDGVKLKGYFYWSLMDNFEWSDGYRSRFGLYRVEFNDPERPRVAKNSAKAYKEIILNNGFC